MLKALLIVCIAAAVALVLAVSPAGAMGPRKLKQPASFPLTIAQPGSYVLESNISVTATSMTAIMITADNVTLDLNGFSILGPNNIADCGMTNTGVGVLASSGVTGTTVLNGTVRGFLIGIALRTAARVQRVRVAANCNGIDVEGSSMLSENIAVSNAFGIVLRGNTLLQQNVADLSAIANVTGLGCDATATWTTTGAPTVRPIIEAEQFAATGTGTWAAADKNVGGCGGP